MVFKDEKDLERFLESKCKAAVNEAKNKVYSIIKMHLAKYYSEFTPEYYIRTNQLLHSLVKSNVTKKNGSYVAEVYFDDSLMNYETGWISVKKPLYNDESTAYASWGANEVLDTAMKGSHGGYTNGTAIWSESEQEFAARFGTIYNLLLQELKSQGIPVVK